MTLLGEKHSQVLTIRLPLDLVEQVAEFAADGHLTTSGALRVLIERGIDSNTDLERLASVSYNAQAVALEALERHLSAALEAFRGETR